MGWFLYEDMLRKYVENIHFQLFIQIQMCTLKIYTDLKFHSVKAIHINIYFLVT